MTVRQIGLREDGWVRTARQLDSRQAGGLKRGRKESIQ